MHTRVCLLILTGLAVTSCSLSTPPPPEHPPERKVTVIGTATIKVVPDQMYWNVQVLFHATTLADAKTAHDASLNAVLTYLKSLGDGVKDLQTGGIRFDKQTYFPEKADRSKPFSCSTQLTFTLTDFDKYPPICDTLSKIDGVEVQGIDYASSKQSDIRRQALQQALSNAHDKAGDLATTAHCSLQAPLDIVESSGDGPRPLMMNSYARADDAGGTPNAVAGQIEINGTVTATYELWPK